jgi:hypothetical protein
MSLLVVPGNSNVPPGVTNCPRLPPLAFASHPSVGPCLLSTVRVVNPPKLVVVRRGGQGNHGELEAWRREPDGWLGYLRYAV